MNKNIYHLWNESQDDDMGLWVIRHSWSQMVARVLRVDPMIGDAPYYNSPKVWADIYWLSGRLHRTDLLSCPGGYSYKKVKVPAWAGLSLPGVGRSG